MDSGAGDPVWCSDAPASSLALVAALELEARIPRALLGARCPRTYVSGPGPERARAAAQLAIGEGARGVVAFGLAGGLKASIASGTVALPGLIVDEHGEWPVDEAWRKRLLARLGAAFPVSEAPLYSADRVVTTPAEKSAIAARKQAAAVDMESAAIAAVAAAAGVACIALRVIADDARDRLPDRVEQLVSDEGGTRYAGLARVVTSPQQFGRLLRLARRSGLARRRLEAVVRHLKELAS